MGEVIEFRKKGAPSESAPPKIVTTPTVSGGPEEAIKSGMMGVVIDGATVIGEYLNHGPKGFNLLNDRIPTDGFLVLRNCMIVSMTPAARGTAKVEMEEYIPFNTNDYVVLNGGKVTCTFIPTLQLITMYQSVQASGMV